MRRHLSIPAIDPFLVWLIVVVLAASLMPAQGGFAVLVERAADLAIALLFFLHGARLSREAILGGLGNWRLHLMVLGSTYVLFPLLGLGLVAVAGGWIDPQLGVGLIFLALLPSTVQSSIAFTAIARGNVTAAVCSASLSNLLGIVVTPLLAALFLGSGEASGLAPWHAINTIVAQILLPFVAGHLLRPVIGGFVDRHRRILQPVDRGSILLVVYSAFGAAVINGIWTRLDLADLVVLLALCAVLLAAVMIVNVLIARLAGLPRADAIVLLFCGSKKSLASGVPMAGALFAPAMVGLVVLPLMVFHQLQLFLCAALAARYRREAEAMEAAVPTARAHVLSVAAERGIALPEACVPGVLTNLALLDEHAACLRRAQGARA